MPIEIRQFVHTSEVMTETLVGVDTVKSYGNKEINNFTCLTQSCDMKEWVASESYSTLRRWPFMMHLPWIRS